MKIPILKPHAFTVSFNEIKSELKTEVSISLPSNNPKEYRAFKKYKYIALWDTGANISVISNKVLQKLKLQPLAPCQVNSSSEGFPSLLYLVNIYLPKNCVIPSVIVAKTKDDWDEHDDITIGMDIITMGDFAITNKNNSTCLSFRIPSLTKTDYLNDSYKNIKRKYGNYLCGCDSGDKFKDCCLNEMIVNF